MISGDGHHVAVGSTDGHIWLFDASDPLNLQKVFDVNYPGSVSSICVEGNAMYAITGSTLKVYDISLFPIVTAKPDVTFPADGGFNMVYRGPRLYINKSGIQPVMVLRY